MKELIDENNFNNTYKNIKEQTSKEVEYKSNLINKIYKIFKIIKYFFDIDMLNMLKISCCKM